MLQSRYVLGDASRSLMVGFGKNPPTHVQSRTAQGCNGITNCNGTRGLNDDRPNPHILYGAVPWDESVYDNYNDTRNSNSTQVDIGNNAPFAGTFAGLSNAPGTWDQCLQGYGVLNKDASVCTPNS